MTTVRERLEEKIPYLIQAYQTGTTIRELAERFACSQSYIGQMLRKGGVVPRKRTEVVQHTEAILRLHKEGMTAYAIDKQLGLPRLTAGRILNKHGIDISARKWKANKELQQHTEVILKRYLNGETPAAIGKDYGCGQIPIRSILKKTGTKLRTRRDLAYPVDEAFFDQIDTEEKAYVFGFFMADACNRNYSGSISLTITDLDILQRISRIIKYEGPLHIILPKKSTHAIQYEMRIGSRKMSDVLARLGCVTAKSTIATYPDATVIPPHLTKHLIRGWLDGDGCITHSKNRRMSWTASIVGTEAVCRGLSNVCLEHLGFEGSVCPNRRTATHTTWTFSVGGSHQLKRFLDWLYTDATVYLKRKHQRYLEFLAERDAQTRKVS